MSSFADRVIDVKSQVTDEELVKERRAQIVLGAVQLFAEKGYYRTTVQEVARRVGVSPGLIYQYVRDKEDLLLLSILDVLDSYAQEIPAAVKEVEGPLERCCTAFTAYCRVVDMRRDATILAYRSTKSLSPERRRFVMEAEEETNQLIGTYIRECVEHDLFRDVDIDLATYQLVMYAHAWALKHWHFVKRLDLDAYISQGLDFFLQGLLSEHGRTYLERSPAL